MKIYEIWNKKLDSEEAQEFYKTYLDSEKEVYKRLLADKTDNIKGKISEVCRSFNMEDWVFAGFLDGINTSLKTPVELENLEEESEIDITIDFEKLLYNMHNAKAEWLYGLDEWDNILSKEKRAEIKKQYTVDHTAVRDKVGRNDPCPCGSRKKYKKCCGK